MAMKQTNLDVPISLNSESIYGAMESLLLSLVSSVMAYLKSTHTMVVGKWIRFNHGSTLSFQLKRTE